MTGRLKAGRVKVGRWKVGGAIALASLSLIALGVFLWLNRPFQAELGVYRTSLADRSEAQRHNIRQAVLALDGLVIEPGETFSFNEVVGPRTPERGYREAPAFMERDLVTSIGGGICQVSSTVYNAAALAGLRIVERHAHSRRVLSVPPGRDATVWYGMADLRFKNNQSHPLRMRLRLADEALHVSVLGHAVNDRVVQVQTLPLASAQPGFMTYQTLRILASSNQTPQKEILSLDVYAK